MTSNRRPLLVSFSGIDGAGKSTQINMLLACLTEAGFSSILLTFWDDVAAFSRFREYCSHAVFRGEKGVGSPEKPINRKDKNIQSWPAMLMRLFFYLFDATSLNLVVAKARRKNADVVIFDRYMYDELANLPLQRWFVRAYIRIILKVIPRPDVAYLVDADPAVARKRKPEYPYEFLERNRASYLAMKNFADEITVIAPASIPEAQWRVVEELVQKLPDHQLEFFSTAKALIES
jgi:thymidylate kinase